MAAGLLLWGLLLLVALSTVTPSSAEDVEACTSVELARIENGNNKTKAVERYRSTNLRFFNGHNIYAGDDDNSGGMYMYYMPSVIINTATANISLQGWALDEDVGNRHPAVMLSDCDTTPGNMGPDTCSTVHARMIGNLYNPKILAQEGCTACRHEYYLASSILGDGGRCLKKMPPGSECWQQDQCITEACWGYHCCASEVAADDTKCAACDKSGQCICDAALLCEIFDTDLTCNNRDLRTAPCGLPHNTTLLNLQNNSLTTISTLLLNTIPLLQSLCLGINPLNCCSMAPVQHHAALDLGCPKPAVCAFPPAYEGLALRSIDTNQLLDSCFGDSPSAQSTTNELIRIMGGVIFGIFVATIAMVVLWKRHRNSRRLRAKISSSNSDDAVKLKLEHQGYNAAEEEAFGDNERQHLLVVNSAIDDDASLPIAVSSLPSSSSAHQSVVVAASASPGTSYGSLTPATVRLISSSSTSSGDDQPLVTSSHLPR